MAVMKFITAIFFVCIFLAFSDRAEASQAEVRDVAISNNCPPKKIEIFQQSLGVGGSTIYRVQCVLPKTVGKTEGEAKPPDALLINCVQNLCNAQQPVMMEKK